MEVEAEYFIRLNTLLTKIKNYLFISSQMAV